MPRLQHERQWAAGAAPAVLPEAPGAGELHVTAGSGQGGAAAAGEEPGREIAGMVGLGGGCWDTPGWLCFAVLWGGPLLPLKLAWMSQQHGRK